MALISRNTKSAGGTDFTPNTTAFADEVDADIDTIVTEVNGQLDDANIKASAAIDGSKIDDHSDNDATQVTTSDPGTSDSQNNATTLEGELQTLRYAIERLALGIDADRNDGAQKDANWLDIPYRPGNHIRNGSFEVYSGAANSAPDGWDLVGTPTTVAQAETHADNGEGKAISIVSAGSAADGIQQTIAGLKPATRYLVVASVTVSTGSVSMVTDGFETTGEWQDSTVTQSTTATPVVLKSVVQTLATVTDTEKIQFLAQNDATADAWTIDHVGFYECNANPVPAGGSYIVRDSITTNTASHYTTASFVDSGVSAAVTVPGHGYQIRVSGRIQAEGGTSNAQTLVCKLLENGVEVDSAAHYGDEVDNIKFVIPLGYVLENPTPGTTYTYTMAGRAVSQAFTRNGAPLFDETPITWIEVCLFKL